MRLTGIARLREGDHHASLPPPLVAAPPLPDLSRASRALYCRIRRATQSWRMWDGATSHRSPRVSKIYAALSSNCCEVSETPPLNFTGDLTERRLNYLKKSPSSNS